MNSSLSLYFAITIVAYISATVLIWRSLVDKSHKILPALFPVLAGWAVHAWIHLGPVFQGMPLNFAFFHALSLVSGVLVLIWMLVAFNPSMRSLGTVILPYACIALSLLLLVSNESHAAQTISWQLEIHAALAVLAYASLSLAAMQAVLLWVLDYILRHPKYLKFAGRLPPLQVMEALLFRIVAVGFLLLTLTLLSGILFVSDLFAQHLVHKTVLSILAWLVFGVLILGRYYRGWRGKAAIRWTLSGMALLILAYFGSKFVIELILNRG